MRSAFLFGVLSASLLTSQAAAEIVFRGTFKWTKVENCEFTEKGDLYVSQYHPNDAPGNFNFSGITHLYQFGGAGYDKEGAFNENFRAVRGIGLGWSGFTFDGAKVRVTDRKPAQITATTRTVLLKGQIQGPDNDPGVGGEPCIASFDASYVRAE
jgi:hypothetical protein